MKFVAIPMKTVQQADLSLEALGLLVFLNSIDEGESKINIQELSDKGLGSVEILSDYLEELVQAGCVKASFYLESNSKEDLHDISFHGHTFRKIT